jgi:hypothetical protein
MGQRWGISGLLWGGIYGQWGLWGVWVIVNGLRDS